MSSVRKRGRLAPLDDLVVAHYYTRVSGDKQADDGLSLEQQPERCEQYISRLPNTILGEHFQDVLSGRRNDRKDYQRMLLTIRGLALQGRRQMLVIPAFDRFGRNVLERVRAYEELEKLDVPLHGIREGGVVQRFVYTILAAASEEETRLLGVRLREINAGLATRGWHKPGSAAWGYQRRERTDAEHAAGAPKTVLEIDETTAPYVREAWKRLARGESIRSIAAWVAELPDSIRGGRNLGFQAVRKMFRAPIYVGRLGEYDDEQPAAVLDRPRANEPHLIGDDVWLAAVGAKRMASKMPRQASGEYPLTGLLRCYRCGSRMSGRMKGTQGGTRAPRREYICHAGLTLGASQPTKCLATVKADMLEARVIETVTEILEATNRVRDARGRERIGREIDRRIRAEQQSNGRPQIPGLEAQRAKVRKRKLEASNLLVDGVMARDDYQALQRAADVDLERIEAELARLRGRERPSELLSLDTLLRGVSGWAEVFSAAKPVDPVAMREALGVLLERVEPVRLARGVYEARLEWTPTGRQVFGAAMALEPSLNLVSVDHLGRTECSTHTMSDEPLAASA